jgi:cytidylate kinase
MTKTSPPSIIALDGPAASGKSTLGRKLADALGYLFFDTGVMYRAVTWIALQRGVDPRDEAAVTELTKDAQIDIRPPSVNDGRACDVLIGGRDVAWEMRKGEVDAYVSIVSVYPGVRQALTEQQRRIGLRGKVVMVGRDIGTVVLPEADLKIYLDASPKERARRRHPPKRDRARSDRLDPRRRPASSRRRCDHPSHRRLGCGTGACACAGIVQIIIR